MPLVTIQIANDHARPCVQVVATRGAPGNSYLHVSERCMSTINLALNGCAFVRPIIDPTKYPGMEEISVGRKRRPTCGPLPNGTP